MSDLRKEDFVEIVGTEHRGHVDYVGDLSVDVRTTKTLFTVPKELVKVIGPPAPREPKGDCVVRFKWSDIDRDGRDIERYSSFFENTPDGWKSISCKFPWERLVKLFWGYPEVRLTVYRPSMEGRWPTKKLRQ